jgi:hypothetical protein
MARTVIWLLAVLLASGMGLPNPAAASWTLEFTQTSSSPSGVGVSIGMTLDNAAFWDGLSVSRSSPYGPPPFDLLGAGMPVVRQGPAPDGNR